MKSGSMKSPGDKMLSYYIEEMMAEHMKLSQLKISPVLEYGSSMEMLNTSFFYS